MWSSSGAQCSQTMLLVFFRSVRSAEICILRLAKESSVTPIFGIYLAGTKGEIWIKWMRLRERGRRRENGKRKSVGTELAVGGLKAFSELIGGRIKWIFVLLKRNWTYLLGLECLQFVTIDRVSMNIFENFAPRKDLFFYFEFSITKHANFNQFPEHAEVDVTFTSTLTSKQVSWFQNRRHLLTSFLLDQLVSQISFQSIILSNLWNLNRVCEDWSWVMSGSHWNLFNWYVKLSITKA